MRVRERKISAAPTVPISSTPFNNPATPPRAAPGSGAGWNAMPRALPMRAPMTAPTPSASTKRLILRRVLGRIASAEISSPSRARRRRYRLPRHVVGIRTGQERDDVGDVLGLLRAPERDGTNPTLPRFA